MVGGRGFAERRAQPYPPSSRPESFAGASPIHRIIDDLYQHLKNEHAGEVATYIPKRGKADPNWFGIYLVTADGATYEAGDTAEARIARIVEVFSRYVGRALEIDQTVYRSESEPVHRNRSIGQMLRNFSILTEDPTPTLEA